MDSLAILAAAVFLPLFPLSMVFNWLLGRASGVFIRVALIVAWPQIGLSIWAVTNPDRPEWLVTAAVITSMLYALRALALRDIGQWTGFLATSAWALLWIPLQSETPVFVVQLYAFGFSAPMALLAILAGSLERRFGAAYTGLYGGLAEVTPRLAAVLVFIVLAIIATPLFPSFFILLATILEVMSSRPGIALGVVTIWLFWSWAGARVLGGLIAGPASHPGTVDLGRPTTWSYTAVLAMLVVVSLYLLGGLS